MNIKKIKVNEENVGKRVDSFIANVDKDISRSTAQRLIEEGNIKVNGAATKVSYKVKLDDEIEIIIPEAKEINLKAQDIPLNIIYEDNDIIVINKPKGMVVHPANGNLDGTLVNAVMAICKDSLSGIGGEIRPGIVHRLDKDTSGAIIVAKNDKAHINLSEQLKNHEVKKTYIALVRGIIKEDEATINMPIARSTSDRKKMAVDKKGKEAITHFKVLGRYDNKYTLLEITIETGRTHQIRVHLSHIGFPIIGDEVYSNGKNEWGIKGQCLHAWKIKFAHPITKEEMSFEAEIPKYFREIIQELEERNKF
jgi:23S rRNA pseudouridine1911/1915/1917 synthase